MTTKPTYLPPPPLVFVIQDNSLPLYVLEEFAATYTVLTAGDVRVVLRWGGPAAGGPGWGGPEIAVIIVIGELLRRGTSDAYNLAKAFILDLFSKIRTRNAARWYLDGAMALAVDAEDRSLRLLFCFPEGLDRTSLEERVKLVEEHCEEALTYWVPKRGAAALSNGPAAEIRLCWDEESARWIECEPMPDDEVQ